MLLKPTSKIIRKLFFLSVILIGFTPSLLFAEYINLPKDADGWTVFTPSDDTRICYISADGDDFTARYYSTNDTVVGSDPFKPVGPIKAYATFAAAYADTRDGYPDWILFERGDTFLGGLGTINKDGKSVFEPFLIGSYGSSGRCPVVETSGRNHGFAIRHGVDYVALMGIDFYAKDRNENDGGSYADGKPGFEVYVGDGQFPINAILIEGCKFRYYEYGATLQSANGGDIDVEIRRNLFSDNYGYDDEDSQGIYGKLVNNLKLEENYFIHNGWLIASSGEGKDRSNGQATIWNHGIYLNSTKNLMIKSNVFLDVSTSNIKLTKQYQTNSTIIDNNLFVGGEGLIQAGNNFRSTEYDYHFANFSLENNVATNIGRGNHTNINSISGIKVGAMDGGSIKNNLLINSDPAAIYSHALAAAYDQSRNVIWSNNVVYKFGRKFGVFIGSGNTGSSNISFTNNKVQIPGITLSRAVISADYDIRGEWSLNGNKYYTNNQVFEADGNNTDLAGWINWSGDNATFSQVSFPDETRDIDTYMTNIGKTPTIDAFIAVCRAQGRYNWNPNYEAVKVNSWIRAGFFNNPLQSNVISPPKNLVVIN